MPRQKKKSPRVADVLAAVDQIAPFRLAESWDNVGLQFGHPDAPAGRILVGLEITDGFLAEARQRRAGTLVTHHPLIFRPAKTFREDHVVPALGTRIIRQKQALIAAHTNFDSVAYGTNGVLADALDLQAAGRRFLKPAPASAPEVKFVVFVPVSHIDQVIDAVSAAGAGVIGDYSHCTFRTPGTGTFKPLEGADPWSGTVGEIQHEEEVRLETVCPKHLLRTLLLTVSQAHPYEEMAYDIYPVEPDPVASAGLGLIGNLKKKMPVSQVVTHLKRRLKLNSVALIGDSKKKVERVAVCTGAGGSIIHDWQEGTADLFITGELSHHDAHEAEHRGITTLLIGHWESEVIAGPRFAELIQATLAEMGFPKVSVASAEKEAGPIRRL